MFIMCMISGYRDGLGGSDTANFKDSVKIASFAIVSYACGYCNYVFAISLLSKKDIYKNIIPIEELQKFDYTTPSQLAKEPNVMNVKIEQNYGKWNIIGNHSDFKNPETMQIIQKEMEKRRINE